MSAHEVQARYIAGELYRYASGKIGEALARLLRDEGFLYRAILDRLGNGASYLEAEAAVQKQIDEAFLEVTTA